MKNSELDVHQFFLCSCGCDALLAHKCVLVDEDPSTAELFLSMWNRGNGKVANKLSWRARVQWVLRALWTGDPYGDEVILTKDTALELRDWLTAQYDQPTVSTQEILP